MTPDADLERKLWKTLASYMTMLVDIDGVEDGHARPMTAQLDGDEDGGPIRFFTSTDDGLVQALPSGNRATATFTSKGHDLFASVHGKLAIEQDRAMVDRLWNSNVAAWFEGGKDDPKLVLLRLDAETAEIWADASGLVAGIKALFGGDHKEDDKDKVAEVASR